MQVIEKVKVVPEGYNGAGMNYDGGNRRDVNGKANAGLTLGIIGTALGGLALFGNRRSTPASILGGAGGGMLGDGSTNINVLGATAGSGSGAPTAFQAWEKSIDNKVFESAITFWFKDVDFDGDKVWEYFHMNN